LGGPIKRIGLAGGRGITKKHKKWTGRPKNTFGERGNIAKRATNTLKKKRGPKGYRKRSVSSQKGLKKQENMGRETIDRSGRRDQVIY